MHIRSILNRVEKLKGFVYTSEKYVGSGDRPSLEVTVRPRKGCKGLCASCGKKGPTYDTGEPRRFKYIPIWGIMVFFIYCMRRIDCKKCGVTTEMIPWA